MISLTVKKRTFEPFLSWMGKISPETWIILVSAVLALVSTAYSFMHGYTISYGDAESHLNIAKRVVDSLTPGFAQLGGIWLPLPHVMLMPFVYSDFLWRTGLAGSIVSGICYIISAVFIYRLGLVITGRKAPGLFAAAVFAFNPNILYLQTTPMTELPLIVFFVLSSYYFIRFMEDEKDILNFLLAAIFGFCASLSRYDGWALVLMEAGVIFLYYFPWRIHLERLNDLGKKGLAALKGVFAPRAADEDVAGRIHRLEGRLVLFATLAFFGILLWLVWDQLILGDALYFTHSEFSANSQQQSWLSKGELPAYHNIWLSFVYYAVTSMSNSGVIIFAISVIGLVLYLRNKGQSHRFFVPLILLVPLFFNVLTLFLGQSVIFIPGLTPISFEWTLFNVRYGTIMVPAIAIFAGYLFYRSRPAGRLLLVGLVLAQCALFAVGFSPTLAFDDGVRGLSSATAKMPDAQQWIAKNYDGGMVLTDDFARTISIIRTPIPMKDVIYIGNKPYWEESLVAPEKYARWIVIQKDDTLWKTIYEDPVRQGRLFKYFNKAYTSEEILIFQRNSTEPAPAATS